MTDFMIQCKKYFSKNERERKTQNTEIITVSLLPLPLSRAKPEPQGGLSEAPRGGEGHRDIGRGSPLIGRRAPRRRRRHGRRVKPLGTNVKRSNISSPPEWSDFTYKLICCCTFNSNQRIRIQKPVQKLQAIIL